MPIMSQRNRTVKMFYELWGRPKTDDGTRPIDKDSLDEQRCMDPQCADDVKSGSGREVVPGDKAPLIEKNEQGAQGNEVVPDDEALLVGKYEQEAGANGNGRDLESAMSYPLSLLVNQFFMIRADQFKKSLGIDHYWGRVEFAPDRGQIHLHILAPITNKKKCIAQSMKKGLDGKFLTNDKDFKPLCKSITVMGAGGTGKSHMINTIITVIRELTGANDSICVAGPSGRASYNIGGSTLHKLFQLSSTIVVAAERGAGAENVLYSRDHTYTEVNGMSCKIMGERI